jgi:spore germination protein GerM
MFLAVKENDQWKLVYDGNGAAQCDEIEKYNFPADFLEGICDPEPTPPAAEIPDKDLTVRVYFNNPDKDPNWEFECSNVLAVERKILETRSVALAAMTELLKGPTDAEKNSGYVTNINAGVKVQKLTIENGVAKIDFDERLEYQVGGSCKTSAIIAQIKQTLKQFSTVKDVVISINGKTEGILQP